MKKQLPIRTNLKQTYKANIIHQIIRFSKTANEVFGTPLLTLAELEKIPYLQLKNIEAELRIQLGYRRNRYSQQMS